MSITVGDLQQVLSRSARPQTRGMGVIYSPTGGVYIDTDTGREVVPYGNGTYFDGASGQVLDQNGRPLANVATGVGDPTAAAPGYSSPSSSGPSAGQVVGEIAQVGGTVAGLLGALLGGPKPAAAPPPAPPMSTGEKVAIGVGLVGLAGGVAWGLGAFDKPRRRRR